MKLYEITTELKTAVSQMEDAGFDEETVADTLESMTGDFESKCISIASYIKNLEIEEQAIEEAVRNMQHRKQQTAKKREWMEGYLLRNMLALEKNNIFTPQFDISTRKTPEKVIVDNPDDVAQKWMKKKTTYTMDIAGMKEAMKSGKKVRGAHLESGHKVNIK